MKDKEYVEAQEYNAEIYNQIRMLAQNGMHGVVNNNRDGIIYVLQSIFKIAGENQYALEKDIKTSKSTAPTANLRLM